MIFGAGILLLINIVWIIFPPKEINGFWGYRTFKSMSSRSHWEFANRFAPKILFYFTFPSFIVGVILQLTHNENLEMIVVFIIIIGLLLTLFLTENRLKKLKDE